MSDDARDPRTDPRPGDVLEVWEGRRKVTEVNQSHVWSESPDGYRSALSPGTWKVVMTNARVVARGAGAQGGGGGS
jgi:hypothetical protein